MSRHVCFRWASLALGLVLFVGAPVLHANPEADRTEQAKRHFTSGVKLFQDGNYAGALAEFEAAYRNKPGPNSLKNVALSQKGLFRYAEAADTLEQVLKRHDAELSAEERVAIRAAIDELASLVGSIVVRASVPDARLSVNGRQLEAEESQRPLRLNVGEHTLVAEAPGYARATRIVRVAGGQRDVVVDIQMKATSGFIEVRAQSPEDAIAIGGVPLKFGYYRGPFPPGRHLVQVYRSGFAGHEQMVMVELGSTVTVEAPALEARLEPAPVERATAASQARGWYGLIALSGLGLGNEPKDLDFSNTDAAGGSFGVRAGYRLWTPIAVELLLETGRHELTNVCDKRVESTTATRPCDTSPFNRTLRLDSFRLGPNLRIMSAGHTLRFTSVLGVGAVRHRLLLDPPSGSDEDREKALPGGEAKGWDPYFLLEVGAQYNWGHVLLELNATVFLDGASNTRGNFDDGSTWAPYEETGGILMAGLGLRAGWSEWTPKTTAAPR